MNEHGFYHPDIGYWQAIDGDPTELLANYPEGTIVVPVKPGQDYELQDGEWVPVEPIVVIPNVVSSRQFKLQLDIAGLYDAVDAWVDTQPRRIRIAYDDSATFVRTDEMMQLGFSDLGFTTQQIDEFFLAASQL